MRSCGKNNPADLSRLNSRKKMLRQRKKQKRNGQEKNNMLVEQSANHLLFIEPAVFFANPETSATNPYQNTEEKTDPAALLAAVRLEIDRFTALLESFGVKITRAPGSPQCPDHIFPGNWVSTHPNRTAVYYPMMAKNRRAERTPEICAILEKQYKIFHDYAPFSDERKFLEGTGSFVLDRINRIAYLALSERSHKTVAEKWATDLNYELVCFDTITPQGMPVYHTDLMMFIGRDVAGVCFDCIPDEAQRRRLRKHLAETHDIVSFSMEQMNEMCGNALEVRGEAGIAYLTMSSRAYAALTSEQERILRRYYVDIIHSPLEVVENYGGGSARCLILELF
ncbi:MAG: hypothetical protein D8M28_07690 [Proteobacteria bacterium]|nr:hypothetical protein [Pseudomonadota bacterium]